MVVMSQDVKISSCLQDPLKSVLELIKELAGKIDELEKAVSLALERTQPHQFQKRNSEELETSSYGSRREAW